MGYAIPIGSVIDTIADLSSRDARTTVPSGGSVFIGASVIDVTAAMSGLARIPQGAYVSRVLEGTPAERAGLLEGDVIVSADGQSILSVSQLQDLLHLYRRGESVTLTVVRDKGRAAEEDGAGPAQGNGDIMDGMEGDGDGREMGLTDDQVYIELALKLSLTSSDLKDIVLNDGEGSMI